MLSHPFYFKADNKMFSFTEKHFTHLHITQWSVQKQSGLLFMIPPKHKQKAPK